MTAFLDSFLKFKHSWGTSTKRIGLLLLILNYLIERGWCQHLHSQPLINKTIIIRMCSMTRTVRLEIIRRETKYWD